jgi:hypothetical protein
MSFQELQVTTDVQGHGPSFEAEGAILVGNYHNGPLSVLLSFGIWGAIGWLWFLAASIRALHYNYKYGEESLQKVNTFLLAYFVARTIFFFLIFGDFRLDFAHFLGVVGLGLALNGGIRKPAPTPTLAKPIVIRPRPALRTAPAFHRGA